MSNFSTEHAFLNIVNTCYDNIKRKMYSGLVLLDLAKAFDTVDHHILLQKLEHYGIRGIVLHFYQSFLENRKQLKHVLAKVDKSHFAVTSKSRLKF